MTEIMQGPLEASEVRAAVQERYAAAAKASLAATGATGCCGGPDTAAWRAGSDPITGNNYDAGDVPSSSALNASLGCGNPTLLAQLEPGQVVLDLGSGGGLDVLLSARRVGPTGKAYGLDMTPEMLELAHRHQAEACVENAEFLLGTIEAIPLPDATVDVIISNCVINLSADKDAVLREAFRVLRPGGRFAVSDIVLRRALPPILTRLVGLWTGCIAGALQDTVYLDKLTAAGFTDASVQITRNYNRNDLDSLAGQLTPADIPDGVDAPEALNQLDGAFASAFVRAIKPL